MKEDLRNVTHSFALHALRQTPNKVSKAKHMKLLYWMSMLSNWYTERRCDNLFYFKLFKREACILDGKNADRTLDAQYQYAIKYL